MATTLENILGSQTTIFSSSTSALASNSYVTASSAYNNTQGNAGNGYTRGRLTLNVTFSTAPTTPSSLYVWLLTSEDGLTYELGGTGATLAPARAADCSIPFIATTSAQQLVGDCILPVGSFVVYVQNSASAQNMTAGWTLKLTPYTSQAV